MPENELLPFDPNWLKTRGNYMTLITPEIAAELLERNRNNRKMKANKIAEYARDMMSGRWDPDASDLKTDRNGDLLDGQNRCAAAVRANVSFGTLLRTGLAPESKVHVDTGAKRSASEALKMAGVGGYHAAIAAAINYRFRINERREFFESKRAFDTKPLVTLTHEEMIGFLERHPAIEKLAPDAQRLRTLLPVLPISVILAFLSLAAEADEAAASDFVYKITHGEYGGPGDPIQGLFEYAARTRFHKGVGPAGKVGRVAQEEHYLALLKVWAAWRRGEKLKERIAVRANDKIRLPE
jgi:hypothetical protein